MAEHDCANSRPWYEFRINLLFYYSYKDWYWTFIDIASQVAHIWDTFVGDILYIYYGNFFSEYLRLTYIGFYLLPFIFFFLATFCVLDKPFNRKSVVCLQRMCKLSHVDVDPHDRVKARSRTAMVQGIFMIAEDCP
jgi:hypothetical protein